MSLLEAIDLFLEVRSGENLSPRTLTWYRDLLVQFAGFAGEVALAQVRALTISRWLAVEAKRLKSSSVDARYRALLCFFNWCETRDELGRPASPMGHGRDKAVKRPRTDDLAPEHVSYGAYRRIVDAIDLATWIDLRDYALLGVLFWCGLRAAEVCSLRVAGLELAHGLMSVAGKGRKGRLVPLSEDVVSALLAYLPARPAESDAVWLAADPKRTGAKGPLQPDGLRMMLKRRCKAAGVPFRHPHSFRHGFAMVMLNSGMDMSAVAALMGHASEKTTETVYARWIISGLVREYREVVSRVINVQHDM